MSNRILISCDSKFIDDKLIPPRYRAKYVHAMYSLLKDDVNLFQQFTNKVMEIDFSETLNYIRSQKNG